MVETVVPFAAEPSNSVPGQNTQLMQISVYIKADVMTPKAALKKANVWLSMNAGHLLLAENPELILREPLQWRFDVIYSVPQRSKPGTTQRTWLGRMQLDAVTGEVIGTQSLLEELTANANAFAARAA